MRCRDAKQWLTAQRHTDLAQLEQQNAHEYLELQEHLQQCPACRSIQQHQQNIDTLLRTSLPQAQTSISTERIMLAVQQHKQVSQQLEDIRTQQRARVERTRSFWMAFAALAFFTLSSIPLLILALTIIQTDLVVRSLNLLDSGIGILIVLTQYLQAGLTVATHNNWLLSGVAFVVVIMMGMWLRLMRYPQEA